MLTRFSPLETRSSSETWVELSRADWVSETALPMCSTWPTTVQRISEANQASQALWGGDGPVSGEQLIEAAALMFGSAGSRPAPTSDEVDDWAHMLFG